jgi:hypothetical protein
MRILKDAYRTIAFVAASLGACVLIPVAVIAAPNDSLPPKGFSENVTFTLPSDLKWIGKEGRVQSAIIFGDPKKSGPYGVLYKWFPGNYSNPHFHDQTRWGYVVSGTWWVGSTNLKDENLSVPMRAGTVVVDIANKVHWDGVKSTDKELAVVLVTGTGPVSTVEVDENGKPLAPNH